MGKVLFFDTMIEVADSDLQKVTELAREITRKNDELKAKFDAATAEINALKEKQKRMLDESEIEKKAEEIAKIRAICDGMSIDSKGKGIDDMKTLIVNSLVPELSESFKTGSDDYKKALWDATLIQAIDAVKNNAKTIEIKKEEFAETAEFENI